MSVFKVLQDTIGGEIVSLGVDDWTSMGLKKPVLVAGLPGFSLKLASFNDTATAALFEHYIRHGLDGDFARMVMAHKVGV